MKQDKREIRPLIADGGLFGHHVGIAPYQDKDGNIFETYQLLTFEGRAVAFISMKNGECEDQKVHGCPGPLHIMAMTSWAAQLGEDYDSRELADGEDCSTDCELKNSISGTNRKP